MASISSLMGSSSSSSIYGSRTNNMITGLASGLDTESMIEGMVQGYQQKIVQLQQSKTKLQWQQDAYQSISNKLVEFSRKYTSYAYSTTNLMSSSFFNNAVITTAKGDYADKITASGKSDSTIVINGVKNLASAARYNISAGHLDVDGTTAKGSAVNLETPMQISEMSGSLTIDYGTKSVTIDFSETEIYADENGKLDLEKLTDAINEKLGEQKITNADGEQVKASSLISAEYDSIQGGIVLNSKDSNSVSIGGATGDFAGIIADLDGTVSGKESTLQFKQEVLDGTQKVVNTDGTEGQYLSGKQFTVTLNGQSKTITLGEISLEKGDGSQYSSWNEAVEAAMQEAITDTFGTNSDGSPRIQVSLSGSDAKQTFVFEGAEGDTIALKAKDSGIGELLFGEGNSSISNYLDVSKTLDSLGKLTTENKDSLTCTLELGGIKLTGTAIEVPEKEWVKDDDGVLYDQDGNKLRKVGDKYYATSDGEELLYSFDVTINDKKIDTYTQDTALETIINDINANTEAGVSVSYSKLTNEFVFTANDTGAAEKIEMGDGLAAALFGSTSGTVGSLVDENGEIKLTDQISIGNLTSDTSIAEFKSNLMDKLEENGSTLVRTDSGGYGIRTGDTIEIIDTNQNTELAELLEYTVRDSEVTAGTDAVFTATINGKETTFTRSSNTVDLDGMTVTFEGTFAAEEGKEVTFSSKTDTEPLLDAIKQMVTDFNAMAEEIKKAYTDQPLKQTDGSRYEPLTSEDEEGLTDSEIEAYEEKAKTGILFMDRDLSSLYSELRSAVTAGGMDSAYLRSIGIETSYEDGLTTITLDEAKLKTALETDLDGVCDAFTRSKENGAASDGLMASIQKVTDKYAATTGATKGILIEKAGSKYSPTAALDNTMLDKMEEIDEQIASWQSKMSDKVDYYTNKFTQLELLINQMNSQSSALSGLTSGY